MRILKLLLLAALFAVLSGSAFAQQKKGALEPAPTNKDTYKQPRASEQDYRRALDRIPDKQETAKDPWGVVRDDGKTKKSGKETN